MANPLSKPAPVSLTLLAAGWLALALGLVPWLRDFMAAGFAAGGSPTPAQAWPPPGDVFAALIATVVITTLGFVLFCIWCIRNGGLGRLVEEHLQGDRRFVMAVVIWAAVISAAFLAYGEPTINDAKTHIARSWMWEEAMRSGGVPIWTDLWYGGFLADQFYPPLSHILGGLAGLAGFSPANAVKVIVWLAAITGAVGFGLWCRAVFGSPRAGFLGAVVYSLLPTTDAAWMWLGRLPGSVLMAVLPWTFYFVYRLAYKRGGRRAAAGLALGLAAIVLSHTVQGRIPLFMLLLYSAVLFAGRSRPAPWWLIAGWCAGISVSLCFLVPAYLERGFVNDLTPSTVMLVRWRVIANFAAGAVKWSTRGDAYPGITVLLLALAGFWSMLRGSRTPAGKRRLAAALVLVVSPWVFATGLPPEAPMDTVFLYFGMVFAAAGGVIRWKSPRGSHLFLLAVIALLIDTGPANLVSTYVTHRTHKNDVYDLIESRRAPGAYLELPLSQENVPRSSYWHYVHARPVACPAGPFIQGAPPSFLFRAALIDTAAAFLSANSAPAGDLVEYLALENVGMLACTSPLDISAPSAAVPRGVVVDPEIPVWTIVDASPVSILESTPRLSLVNHPPVTTNGIGTDRGKDRRMSRKVAASVFSWMKSARPRQVNGVILIRRLNAVDLLVPDVGEKTVRIALASYPTMKVRVDGAFADWRTGPLGAIVLDLPAGAHRLTVEVGVTGIRRALSAVLVVLVAGLLLLATIPATRRTRSSDV